MQTNTHSWFGFPDDTVPSSRDFLPGLSSPGGGVDGGDDDGGNGGGGGGDSLGGGAANVGGSSGRAGVMGGPPALSRSSVTAAGKWALGWPPSASDLPALLAERQSSHYNASSSSDDSGGSGGRSNVVGGGGGGSAIWKGPRGSALQSPGPPAQGRDRGSLGEAMTVSPLASATLLSHQSAAATPPSFTPPPAPKPEVRPAQKPDVRTSQNHTPLAASAAAAAPWVTSTLAVVDYWAERTGDACARALAEAASSVASSVTSPSPSTGSSQSLSRGRATRSRGGQEGATVLFSMGGGDVVAASQRYDGDRDGAGRSGGGDDGGRGDVDIPDISAVIDEGLAGLPPVALGKLSIRNCRVGTLMYGDTEPRWYEYVNGALRLGRGYRDLELLVEGEAHERPSGQARCTMASADAKRHLRHVTPGAADAAAAAGRPLKAFGCDSLPASVRATAVPSSSSTAVVAAAAAANMGLPGGVSSKATGSAAFAILSSEEGGGRGGGSGAPALPLDATHTFLYGENLREYPAAGTSMLQRAFGVLQPLPPSEGDADQGAAGAGAGGEWGAGSAAAAASAEALTPEEALRREIWRPGFRPPWELSGKPGRVHPNGERCRRNAVLGQGGAGLHREGGTREVFVPLPPSHSRHRHPPFRRILPLPSRLPPCAFASIYA